MTAIEVARLAGVSQSAVSRAYTPGKSISDKTRAKVLKAAQELGYRPNLLASALITGRSGIVGIAVSSLLHTFYAEAVQALSRAFSEVGMRVMLFALNAHDSADPILEEVLRYRVDAIILVSANLTSRFADECLQSGLPVVLLNRWTTSRIAASVSGDDQTGAKEIARFLIAGGHNHFAYISGGRDSSTSRLRRKGFVLELEQTGVHHCEIVSGDFSYASGVTAARRLFKMQERPDAIFCANDDMAIAVIDTARHEFHMQVGVDVSVVGFDDTYLAQRSAWQLTTYRQPLLLMVQETVKLVMASIKTGELVYGVRRVLGGQLIVRQSARRPNSGVFNAIGPELAWHSSASN